VGKIACRSTRNCVIAADISAAAVATIEKRSLTLLQS
jgi:hypothetical protein